METYRLGYFKILSKIKVIVDSNILLQSVRYGIDVKESVEEALTTLCDIYIPKAVIHELENKAKYGKPSERKAAKRALEAISRMGAVIIEHENFKNMKTDDIVLALALNEKCVLITNDRELRKKAKRIGIPVGFLNIEEKRIIVEYFP